MVKVMHISTVNILQTVTDSANIDIANKYKVARPFHCHIYILHFPILKVKFKVMHVSIVNFSQMMTDRENIAIANKYKVACWLSITAFKFDLRLF